MNKPALVIAFSGLLLTIVAIPIKNNKWATGLILTGLTMTIIGSRFL